MKRLLLRTAGALAALLVAFGAQAATLQLDFDFSFGDPLDPNTQAPEGSTPWLTAEFVDVGPGEVELTMTVSAGVGIADLAEVYFNLDSAMDATELTFLRTGGTGPTEGHTVIELGNDLFQADADGLYDIWFDFPPPPGNDAKKFNAGESLVYTITDLDSLITASSFNFLSTPQTPPNDNGPFVAAAKFGSTGTASNCPGGEGECSDWITPTAFVVPVPATVWLFGSALGLLGWVRRRPN